LSTEFSAPLESVFPASPQESVLAQEATWQRLCTITDIPDAGAIECELQGESLIVLRYGQDVHAYLNVCPHAGRALNWAPGKFLLSHGQLVCAAHGAAFKPESGECFGGPCRGQSLLRCALSLRDGAVFGQLPSR
jgi:nitrite reductase/ring-hydroxylating ferredoxin subunit